MKLSDNDVDRADSAKKSQERIDEARDELMKRQAALVRDAVCDGMASAVAQIESACGGMK